MFADRNFRQSEFRERVTGAILEMLADLAETQRNIFVWNPEGFTCSVARMDVREGGTSLVRMRAPKEFGGQDMFSTWLRDPEGYTVVLASPDGSAGDVG